MVDQSQSQETIVELSTVYCFKDRLPPAVALFDCGLPLKEPIPDTLSAYYGYQSRLEGMVAAREYTQRHGLRFTAIDFTVHLDKKQNRRQMRDADLADHDFLAFHKLSRSMMDDVAEVMRETLRARGIDISALDFSRPHHVLAQHPSLVTDLERQPGWEHLKLIAHPAKLDFSDRVYSVATIPYRHWGSIREAFCRLDPVQITLDSPAPGYRPSISGMGPRADKAGAEAPADVPRASRGASRPRR